MAALPKLPGIPSISPVKDTTIAAILRPMKESIEILSSAVSGNSLASGENISTGFSSYLTGSGTTTSTSTYNPFTDYTPPPKPTGFSVLGAYNNINMSWDAPTYLNHAYTEIWRATSNVFSTAVLIGFAPGALFSDAVGNNQTYYYWIRFNSMADVLGPYNSSTGTVGQTSLDPAYVLNVLNGQISTSQLNTSLSTRINLIDAASSVTNSVNARIAFVQGQVNDLLGLPAYNNSTTYTVNTQVQYSGGIYKALSTTTGNLPTNTTYWTRLGDYTSLGTAVAANTTDITNLQGNLGNEVRTRSILAAQTKGAPAYVGATTYAIGDIVLYGTHYYRAIAATTGNLPTSTSYWEDLGTSGFDTLTSGIVYEEKVARSNAVSAVASSIDVVSATVSTKTRAYFQTTEPVGTLSDPLRVGDIWYDTSISYSQASGTFFSSDYAISTNRLHQWDGTQWVDSPDASMLDSAAAITIERTARTTADAAMAQQITTLFSNVGTANSAIVAEQTTRAAADTVMATNITAVNARVDTTQASVVTLDQTKIGYASTGTGEVYDANGTIYNKQTMDTWNAAHTSDSHYPLTWNVGIPFAQSVKQVYINNGTSTAALEQTFVTQQTLNGNLTAQYYVKADVAGNVAGFGLYNASGEGSQFAVRANRFYVAPPTDYSQETAPTTGMVAGNFWYKPSTNTTYRYTGSAWIVFTNISPFVIQATDTIIGGESVPAGVYIQQAYIANGSITTAKIANLAVDDAKITTLTAAKLTAGTLAVDTVISSTFFSTGVTGWSIDGAGNAEFGAASIRGQLTASQIDSRGLSIKDAAGNIILSAGASVSASTFGGNVTGTVNGTAAATVAANAANALANASTAQSTADTAAANATTALNKLTDIASDNLITPGEKPTVIQDYAVITTEQTGIDTQATDYGITTEKTAYDNAVTTLTTYLGGLTTPVLWSDLTGNTTIVGTTFRANFESVYTTRQTLLNAISAAAKVLADTAQSTANTAKSTADTAKATADTAAANASTALTQLSDIASDNLLTPGEKPTVIADNNMLVNEKAGIDAQAIAYGITTERTTYDTAVAALVTYLATLTSTVLWSDLSGNTTIVGTTFRSKFQDVYAAKQAVLNAIYAAAKVLADTAQTAADSKLAKAGAQILTGPVTLNATSAITVGTPALDAGAGHNGFYIGSTGIVGTKNGAATFTLSNTGDANFKGTLSVGASPPVISGIGMTGTGALINPDGTFALGSATKNIVQNGSDIFINGFTQINAGGLYSLDLQPTLGSNNYTIWTFTIPTGKHAIVNYAGSLTGAINSTHPYFYDITSIFCKISFSILDSSGNPNGGGQEFVIQQPIFFANTTQRRFTIPISTSLYASGGTNNVLSVYTFYFLLVDSAGGYYSLGSASDVAFTLGNGGAISYITLI